MPVLDHRPPPPLAVDLDGTLLAADLVSHALRRYLQEHPAGALRMPIWRLGGTARLVHEVARRLELDPKALPYRLDFLEFLNAEHAAGRTLVLVSSADRLHAERVAWRLGIFDRVFASEEHAYLTPTARLAALRGLYGERGYVYAGNDWDDYDIWAHARAAILVGVPSERLADAVAACTRIERRFDYPPSARGLDGLLTSVRNRLRALTFRP